MKRKMSKVALVANNVLYSIHLFSCFFLSLSLASVSLLPVFIFLVSLIEYSIETDCIFSLAIFDSTYHWFTVNLN